MPSLDALDARIVLALDAEPEASALTLSRTLGVARNTVHARLRRMRENGTLLPFSRRVDLASLGYHLLAFISLSVRQAGSEATLAGLVTIPEVVEVHNTTGDADLWARVVAVDTRDLFRITNQLLAVDGVERTSTVISLVEVIGYRPQALLSQLAR